MRGQREKNPWMLAAVILAMTGLVVAGAVGWIVPQRIKAETEGACRAALQNVILFLDPLVDHPGKEQPALDETVAAELASLLAQEGCSLAQGGVLTVMDGETPMFSLRDRQILPFVSPSAKQYVFSERSGQSGLHYIVTIPRDELDGKVSQLRFRLIMGIILGGLILSALCWWQGGRYSKRDKKK